MVGVSAVLAPRLSRLIIDTNLDMKGFSILNAVLGAGSKLGADLDAQGYSVVNLRLPQNAGDAATKDYADSSLLAHKQAVPIDHPDGSVSTYKLADGAVVDGKLAQNTATVMVEALMYG